MDYKTKLRECRTCAEAGPIMEALHVRPSQRKLIETAIQLRLSKDPRQVAYGEDFFLTALREIEDEEKEKLKEDNGGAHRKQGGEADISGIIKNGGKNEDSMKEADMITGALDSHQSSDIDMPYPQEGKDAPQNDIESSKSATGENQMGGIKENMPGMGMPPMPQQNGMPPMAPDVMKSMAPQMPQMPPMNTPQQMRQMQYTIEMNNRAIFNRVIKPLIQETKKLREAYVALDKKIQETQSQSGTMKLDIQKVKENSIVSNHIRETLPGTNIEAQQTRFPRVEMEERRQEMANMDKELAKHKPKDMYQ